MSQAWSALADGKQLSVAKLTNYTAEKVWTLCAQPGRTARPLGGCQPAHQHHPTACGAQDRFPDRRGAGGQAGGIPARPAVSLSFNAPELTRRKRADRLKRQHVAFFKFFAPEAQEMLDDLREKYASDGERQSTLPDVLKVRPISGHGNVNEIIGKFGGADQLPTAINQLQSLLYAA